MLVSLIPLSTYFIFVLTDIFNLSFFFLYVRKLILTLQIFQNQVEKRKDYLTLRKTHPAVLRGMWRQSLYRSK